MVDLLMRFSRRHKWGPHSRGAGNGWADLGSALAQNVGPSGFEKIAKFLPRLSQQVSGSIAANKKKYEVGWMHRLWLEHANSTHLA